MVDFFEQQRRARLASQWLVVLFALGMLGVVVAVDLIVLAAIALLSASTGPPIGWAEWLAHHSPVVAWVSAAVAATIAIASVFKMISLATGGSAVARQLGATRVAPDTVDLRRSMLRNVVEEISIASGVPVPDIFVLESEPGINAFAAGYSPSDAAVVVTRGTLERLDRSELQGVVAHEFSHVLNGDMRLNIRLIGLLYGLLVLAIIGRSVLRNLRSSGRGDRNGRSKAAVAMVAFGLVAVGYVGVFFGRLIQAAVSRRREFLADASAVQFTRDPGGICGALKKIAASARGTAFVDADAESVSHMLFADGLLRLGPWLATHPPIAARIKAIDPDFTMPELAHELDDERDEFVHAAQAVVSRMRRSRAAVSCSMVGPEQDLQARLVDSIGNPQPTHVQAAADLIASVPVELCQAARSTDDAPALVLALLLDGDPKLRARQLDLLGGPGAPLGGAVDRLQAAVVGLAAAQRLTLAELAAPALRQRPEVDLEALRVRVAALAAVDGETSAFEFMLGRALRAEIRREHGMRGSPIARRDDIVTLLSVIATSGTRDPEAARRSFARGATDLLHDSGLEPRVPPDWPRALDAALDRMVELRPEAKRKLVTALVNTVIDDGALDASEIELLRAVCFALHVPMPPLANGASANASLS